MFTQVTHLANLGNDASGLEKILRLLQALSMLLLSLLFSNNPLIPQLVKARDQFALGRRFLKFFKCVPMLRASVEGRRFGELDLADTLDVVRTAFMGLYLGVESATMIDFMGVYPLPWAAPAMLEANRFWFYSLAISTFLSLYQFFNVPSTPPTTINFSAVAYNEETETKEKTDVEDEKKLAETLAKHRRGLKWKYAKEAVMYGGDLLLPGAATGWILTSPTYVAGAMVVTTLLGLEGIWKRVNAAET